MESHGLFRAEQSLFDASALGRAKVLAPQGGASASPELGEVAEQFEAMLLNQFLRAANRPIVDETPLGGSREERLYREMFYEEVSRLAAQRGGIGLARTLTEGAAGSEDSEGTEGSEGTRE